jgi:hypothetical protein
LRRIFAELKAWYKKNHKLAEGLLFPDIFELAICQLKTNAHGRFGCSLVDVPICDDGNDEDYEDYEQD